MATASGNDGKNGEWGKTGTLVSREFENKRQRQGFARGKGIFRRFAEYVIERVQIAFKFPYF